jgi:reactive intermediate/imine deaminase
MPPMSRKFVTHGTGLPDWSAPISHAVAVGNVCYLSGQLSIDVQGKYVPGTTREETMRAFGNLFAAVRAAGFTVPDIVFIDVALIDLADIAEINDVYSELFPESRRPARTVYQAAALPYGGRVKVMGVAIKDAAAVSE